MQVPPADAEVDAREAESALHPRRIERVADRDLAQLHEARILDARLVDADERAGHHVAIEVLADGHRLARPRPHDRAVIPAALAEDLGVPGARRGIVAVRTRSPLLGVTVRAVTPQGALGAVPDLPAVPDIEQSGELHLLVTERRADATGPVIVRVLHDPWVLVVERVPVASDVERSLGLAGAQRAQVGTPGLWYGVGIRQAAAVEPGAQVHADGLAHHRDLDVEVPERDELRPAEREHRVPVPRPLQPDFPAVVGRLQRPRVE